MVEDGGSSRGWRDAFFYFRDEIEVSFPSVSFLETRTRIFSLNLMVRDEIENSCHLISKFETRSRSFNSLLSNLSQGIVLGWEQSLQKMKVVWWCGKLCCWICEWATCMPCGGGKKQCRCFEKIWIIISFFSRQDRDLYYLVVRDEIEICIFYILCFDTRSRICSIKSWILRRGREIKKDFSCSRFHEIFRDREISSCSASWTSWKHRFNSGW